MGGNVCVPLANQEKRGRFSAALKVGLAFHREPGIAPKGQACRRESVQRYASGVTPAAARETRALPGGVIGAGFVPEE